MQWIVQENLYKEEAFLDLIQALDNYKLEYQVVKVIPFSHELLPEPEVTGNTVVMGATTMIGIAQERRWHPGAFYNSNFDHAIWVQNLGTELLNYEAEICQFKDIKPKYNPFFVRPSEDRKVFSGQVIDQANFDVWLKATEQAAYSGYTTLTPETLVVVSPLKAIHAEWRFFVIDGTIVTGSLYKRGDYVRPLPLLYREDSELYAEQMVNKWQPDRAFVIDIALTDKGYKVIEYNCLNSSGFYKSNVGKIVNAIEEMKYD
jgi:hypothetical protein